MPVSQGVHFDIILEHRPNDNIFVETGTALGETTDFGIKHFAYVFSIEYNQELYWSTFQRMWFERNLSLIHGDSAFYLPHVEFLCERAATFFLDAHSVDEDNIDGYAPSGLTVLNTGRGQVVFVDDARLFDDKGYT